MEHGGGRSCHDLRGVYRHTQRFELRAGVEGAGELSCRYVDELPGGVFREPHGPVSGHEVERWHPVR